MGVGRLPAKCPPGPLPPPTHRGVPGCEPSGCKVHREPGRDMSHDLSHYLEGTKDGSPAGEQPRGMGASVGGWSEWRGRQGAKGLPVGLTLATEKPPQLRCQGNALSTSSYLLTPLPPLLCLCRAVPAWLPHCNLRRCYSVSMI